jgi:hypothetical protein
MSSKDSPIDFPFHEFSSLEDVLAWMQLNEEFVNAVTVTDKQREIQPGDHVVRPYDVNGVPMLIVAKTMTLNEFVLAEQQHGASEAELVHEKAQFKDLQERGYRYGRWFSVICQEGEFGDTHISSLLKISAAQYKLFMHYIEMGSDPYSIWYAYTLGER